MAEHETFAARWNRRKLEAKSTEQAKQAEIAEQAAVAARHAEEEQARADAIAEPVDDTPLPTLDDVTPEELSDVMIAALSVSRRRASSSSDAADVKLTVSRPSDGSVMLHESLACPASSVPPELPLGGRVAAEALVTTVSRARAAMVA